jgi:hypothetical protein
MEHLPALPLPGPELPEAIRRFGDPKAPTPARTMAAKGLVPVKGEQLVALLAQLSADPDAGIQQAANETLRGLPDGVLLAACESDLHGAFLDRLATAWSPMRTSPTRRWSASRAPARRS